MLLFVGLGNPTPDSENNRHNVGFKIIDTIASRTGGVPSVNVVAPNAN